jgi:hypothetical protein
VQADAAGSRDVTAPPDRHASVIATHFSTVAILSMLGMRIEVSVCCIRGVLVSRILVLELEGP